MILHAGDIVVKRDCKIVALRHIPVRTVCVLFSVTHGDVPYYWLHNASTDAFIGGMSAELMTAFRKVRKS